MRLRRRLYVAAAALAALVLIVWQTVFHGQRPRLIWQGPPLQPQQVLASLEQVGSLHCENARLSAVLPLLNDQFGVDITIGEVAAMPRALLVYQDPRFQQQLQELLRIVSEPDYFGIDPLPVGPRNAALEQAMQKAICVRFDNRPLHECLRDVARQAGL